MNKIFLVSVCLLISIFTALSQNLTNQQQQKIEQLIKQNEDYSKEGKTSIIINNLINIGNIYINANMPKEAINYFLQAYQYVEKTQNTNAKLQINNQLGYLYSSVGDYVNSEKYFQNSYNIVIKTNKKLDIISVTSNLAQSLQNQKKYKEAASKYEEALAIALELNNLELCKNLATKCALCFKEIGDQQNFVKYYNLSAMFEKKIAEQKINKKQQELIYQQQIANQNKLKLELETAKNKNISDSLQRQQEINEKNRIKIEYLNQQQKIKQLEVEKNEQEIAKRRIIIYYLLIGLSFMVLASAFIFMLFIRIRKQKERLKIMYQALEEKNKEIAQKKSEIEKKNKQIEDSINYAKRIQMAILPIQAKIQENFKENFIFYRPRDIVSGDFYWFYQEKDIKIIAAIDCTGHSVPGAFMSLIGNTLLNEIVKAKKIFELNKVLELLDTGLVETLHSQENTEVNDGMDISIFKFYEGSRKAYFCGSNHISYIIVDDKPMILEGSFFALGSSFQIKKQDAFTQIEVDLGNQACIYLFTDGFSDQFNRNQQKYSTKRFLKKLYEIHKEPMPRQNTLLQEELYEWIGDYRQIDDILVIGLKV